MPADDNAEQDRAILVLIERSVALWIWFNLLFVAWLIWKTS